VVKWSNKGERAVSAKEFFVEILLVTSEGPTEMGYPAKQPGKKGGFPTRNLQWNVKRLKSSRARTRKPDRTEFSRSVASNCKIGNMDWKGKI